MKDWLSDNAGWIIYLAIIVGSVIYAGTSNESTPEPSVGGVNIERGFETKSDYLDFDDGYEWAEENDIDDFDDCQNEFGTGDAEDGCNEYVQENYSGYDSFNGYDCTEDCSGHEAGYLWAEVNGIDDEADCDGYSMSFIEGCISYVEENY